MKKIITIISGIFILLVATFLFVAAASNKINKQYYDVNASWSDSLGNIDSLGYPYYMDQSNWHDASLIAGQTINFRGLYVTPAGAAADTLFLIVQTRNSGSSLIINSDTNVFVGHVTRDTITQGANTFSSTPGLEWRWKIADGTTGDGAKNRNNGYFIYTEWSTTVNAGPNMLHLGNK